MVSRGDAEFAVKRTGSEAGGDGFDIWLGRGFGDFGLFTTKARRHQEDPAGDRRSGERASGRGEEESGRGTRGSGFGKRGIRRFGGFVFSEAAINYQLSAISRRRASAGMLPVTLGGDQIRHPSLPRVFGDIRGANTPYVVVAGALARVRVRHGGFVSSEIAVSYEL